MSRRFLRQLWLVFACYVPLTQPTNRRVLDDSRSSADDRRDTLAAAQIAFPLLFRQVGLSNWNAYSAAISTAELVAEEDREEAELRMIKPETEASAEIEAARTAGLDGDRYRTRYRTALLDGTLTVMGSANGSYTERSIYLRTGGGMVIPCMLASVPMDDFLWYEDIYGEPFINRFSGALRVNAKKQLSVHEAQPFMSGVYWCSGTYDELEIRNVVYLYVYGLSDIGLKVSVFFRTTSCGETQVAPRRQEILDYLCGNESLESCVDESVADCRLETRMDSNLDGRLELNFFRFDAGCQDERAEQCSVEQKIARILAEPPFIDLRNNIVRYMKDNDLPNDTHSSSSSFSSSSSSSVYLFDAVRTLAEGVYTKHEGYRCPPGFVVSQVQSKPACLPCFSGSSKVELNRGAVCKECDIGTYAPSAALRYCDTCPSELGKIVERRGSKRQDQCYAPVTYRPKSPLDMAFDNDSEMKKKQPMKNAAKVTIVFAICILTVVAVTGGYICCRRRRSQRPTTVGQQLRKTGEGEKQLLASTMVPTVVTLSASSNRMLRKKKRMSIEAIRDKAREEENYADEDEVNAAEATEAKAKHVVYESTRKEATKAKVGDEDMTTGDKKPQAGYEDTIQMEHVGAMKGDRPSRSFRSVTSRNRGLASPVLLASQARAQPGPSSQRMVESGYPTQVVAQPNHSPKFLAQPRPTQREARPGHPPQFVAQPRPTQGEAQPGYHLQFVVQPSYPTQIAAQPGQPLQTVAESRYSAQTFRQPSPPPAIVAPQARYPTQIEAESSHHPKQVAQPGKRPLMFTRAGRPGQMMGDPGNL